VITHIMIVPKFVIDDFLVPYAGSAKSYLKYAEENYPHVFGKFSIEQSVYLEKGLKPGHLTLTDFTICLNQLAYVGVANAILNKAEELDFLSYDYLKKYQTQIEICELSSLKMHGNINPEEFSGILTFGKIRNFRNYFVPAHINFEDKFYGNLMFVIRKDMS
jgi:hypothetical protein